MYVRNSGTPSASAAILKLVCQRCIEELGALEASVVLASGDGLWAPAYSTGPAAEDLEQQAFTLGEGPCYDALRDHSLVLVADLGRPEAQNRWPTWSAAADSVGVRSAAAIPIQAGAITAGVLSLFLSEVGSLHGRQLTLALRLADTALLGLLDVVAGVDGVNRVDRTDSVDRTDGRAGELPLVGSAEIADVIRTDVHQAAGMIMVQADLPIMEALARLRARAYQTGRPLADLARDVLARRLTFSPDGDSAE